MKKIFTIIVTCLILLSASNVAFSENIKNSKQISLENEQKSFIENFLETHKANIYKLIIYEDYITTTNVNTKRKSIGGNIKTHLNKYKNNPKSLNYVYAQKSEKLYYDLINCLTEQNNKFPQKVIIPDNVINKIDEEIVTDITVLNVIIEKLKS